MSAKETVQVKTQQELDTALAEGKFPILIGTGWFTVRGSSHVEAWESSHVEAWESSHVEAWESSHVEAWESSHVEARDSSHVVARGSSHVVARDSSHVEAWESSHVEARDSSHVEAWGSNVAVHVWGSPASVTGGVQIAAPNLRTAEDWCAYHGVPVKDGISVLYKAVRDDYRSAHALAYIPGTAPEAPDWDGGKLECGGGLHFAPHPLVALEFDGGATRFLACPVAISDCRPPHPDDLHPSKIKARRCCGPVVEVDRYGKPLATVPAQGGAS